MDGGGKGSAVGAGAPASEDIRQMMAVVEGKGSFGVDWIFQPDGQPDVISQPDDQPDAERSYKHLAEVSIPCNPCN
jgi:hypothetical protein